MRPTFPTRGLLMGATLLAVLAAELAVETLVRDHELRREQEHTLTVLNGIRSRIEELIYRDLYVVRALATHIATVPHIDQTAFANYVQRLTREPSILRTVAAAPDLTIRFVYPLAGNEGILGVDYRKLSEQHTAVVNTVASHAMVMAGPIGLVQGGSGFVAREAVFLPADVGPPAFWGIVAAVIESDTLYRTVGLADASVSFDLAMRGEGIPDGRPNRVFYGDPGVFKRDVVRTIINLPRGRWVLGACPRSGWLATTGPTLWSVRGAALVLGILLLGFAQSRARSLRRQTVALDAVQRSEHALRRSQQDLINAIEALAEGFALWDQKDHLQVYNQRLIEMLPALAKVIRIGMPFEELIRRMAELGVVGADQDKDEWIAKRIEQHHRSTGALEVHTRAGRIASISEYRTTDGYVVGLYTDITAMRMAEEQIRYRAYYDLLTALPNRENFMNQLATTISHSQRDGASFALLFVDLDHFKNVNDTLGHERGDSLLIEVAQRLRQCLRQSDTVARFGGDEFTIILRDIDAPMNAARSAETVIRALAESFALGGQIVHSGASVGITLYPADGDDEHTLLRNADLAMYRAKARGRNTYRFFASEMTTRAEQFVTLETDLRQALAREEFDFEYQPVVRLADGALAGAEALLRWRPTARAPVGPAEFIPVAEESQLMVDIGAWALRHACRSTAAWCALAGGYLPRLAVNVSGRQLWGGFDGTFVRGVLEETGFPPEALMFEITESLLIDDDRRVGAVLREFRELGVGIALDDFGTGYSALGYLRRFPVTMLKIDRSFVGDIETNPSDARLVESIVALGRALRLTVVAEGVETAGQAHILREMGCDLAQGYYYARPMAAAEFVARYDSSPR